MKSNRTQAAAVPMAPIMIAVFCSVFVSNLNTSTVNLAIPTLMGAFHTEMSVMQWALTGYMMAIGIGSPLAGFLISRYGTKKVYALTLTGFSLASLLCSLAWSPLTLISARVIQGGCAGLMLPVTLTLLYRTAPRRHQPMAVSLWEAAGWLGPALGPAVSGICLQFLSWRWLFLLNLPLLLLSILLVLRYVPASTGDPGLRLDKLSAVLSSTGSFTVLFAFSRASAWGLFSYRTLLLLAAGILLLVLFVRRQLGSDKPLLEFRVFRSRAYGISVLLLGLINAALFAAVYFVPYFLQTAKGVPAASTGLVMLPSSVVMVLLLPVVGKLYSRLGPMKLAAAGISLMVLGTWMLSRMTAETANAEVILWTVTRNIGIAFSSMPLMNAGLSTLADSQIGSATSMTSWVRQCMGSLSIAIFTAFYTWRTAAAAEGGIAAVNSPEAVVYGVQQVFMLVAVLLICMLPLVVTFRKTGKP
ncbi:DHA2 family efflux MFS transporter permease subunit [Paenibacillus sp. MMS20-IR301]|uniref:DHA2 family efflux MFS transporter permease subunit n=1 Tax=Paenibacillus sp. MMS20-IR301 TaxID=2895946 RepID=UPI0028EFB60E|nr:DHA2 family efflux MFS transporter permease subunit [Paenibacillus sp. MMS20-IR301]WNS46020.1 DHA2 family efflux MFS transporter permease subunit [Paenibacillus sp. MMS20-IR301]